MYVCNAYIEGYVIIVIIFLLQKYKKYCISELYLSQNTCYWLCLGDFCTILYDILNHKI